MMIREQLEEFVASYRSSGRPDGVGLPDNLRTLSAVDLSGLDLSGMPLARVHWSTVNLGCANLSFADLRNSTLTGSNLAHADLSFAKMAGANLYLAELSYVHTVGVDMYGAKLCGTVIEGDIVTVGNGITVPTEGGRVLSWNGRTLPVSEWREREDLDQSLVKLLDWCESLPERPFEIVSIDGSTQPIPGQTRFATEHEARSMLTKLSGMGIRGWTVVNRRWHS